MFIDIGQTWEFHCRENSVGGTPTGAVETTVLLEKSLMIGGGRLMLNSNL